MIFVDLLNNFGTMSKSLLFIKKVYFTRTYLSWISFCNFVARTGNCTLWQVVEFLLSAERISLLN